MGSSRVLKKIYNIYFIYFFESNNLCSINTDEDFWRTVHSLEHGNFKLKLLYDKNEIKLKYYAEEIAGGKRYLRATICDKLTENDKKILKENIGKVYLEIHIEIK